ncbi:Transcriptional regulator, XRE family [uncultured Desulfobacterium sp.]|uniref:Transcriptional regulator, XRE family n=1 Tax=uncultured Desulfobacterium sp. TaxID=201089 RepID=A0A445MY83_9BACT|nr:Transcriptional regulator, XRE family [uncultured Desulfobacterium sp.]
MKCPTCKTEMPCATADHHYKECGLDNVYLRGIEIHRCSCGEEIVSIPAVTKLHSLIGQILLKKRSILDGKEIKFLRKNLGLTGKKFAEFIGTDNATVSRWENETQSISKAHDRLIRLVYSTIKGIPQEEIKSVIQQDFAAISDEKIEPQPFSIPCEQWSGGDICLPESP